MDTEFILLSITPNDVREFFQNRQINDDTETRIEFTDQQYYEIAKDVMLSYDETGSLDEFIDMAIDNFIDNNIRSE